MSRYKISYFKIIYLTNDRILVGQAHVGLVYGDSKRIMRFLSLSGVAASRTPPNDDSAGFVRFSPPAREDPVLRCMV